MVFFLADFQSFSSCGERSIIVSTVLWLVTTWPITCSHYVIRWAFEFKVLISDKQIRRPLLFWSINSKLWSLTWITDNHIKNDPFCYSASLLFAFQWVYLANSFIQNTRLTIDILPSRFWRHRHSNRRVLVWILYSQQRRIPYYYGLVMTVKFTQMIHICFNNMSNLQPYKGL